MIYGCGVVWCLVLTQHGRQVYSPEISRELETARRAGKAEHTLRIGESTYICMIKSDGGEPTQECNDEKQRLRRHFMAEGLSGQWEMMSVKYAPPVSLYGEGAVKVLQVPTRVSLCICRILSGTKLRRALPERVERQRKLHGTVRGARVPVRLLAAPGPETLQGGDGWLQ